MSCRKPMQAWKMKDPCNPRKYIVKLGQKCPFGNVSGVTGFFLPCGKCLSCKLEYSRQWAIRCVHESMMHKYSSFITLTYDQANLPENGLLCKRDFQLFMKRLRKALDPVKIRFFHCGEYGENTHRPHYHACIFGWDFPDRELWRVRRDIKLYRSKFLEFVWRKGFSTVGDVTFESSAYLARYCVSKQKALSPKEAQAPPYITSSRGRRSFGTGGIGYGFYEKYKNEMYAHDSISVRKGLSCKPAKYYDKLFDVDDPETMDNVKAKREEVLIANPDSFDFSRMEVKDNIKRKVIKLLKRGYENAENESLLNV